MTVQFHEKETQKPMKNVKEKMPPMSDELKEDIYTEVKEAVEKGLSKNITFEILADTTGYSVKAISNTFYKMQREREGARLPSRKGKPKQTKEEVAQKKRDYAAKWYQDNKEKIAQRKKEARAKLKGEEVEQTYLPLEEKVVEEVPVEEPKVETVVEAEVEEKPRPSVDAMGMATMTNALLDRIEKLTQERDEYKLRAENAEAKNKRLIKLLDVEV
ncbi:hypothetical protein [Bacillus phage YungSlug]|nr:hypothetical protein [Bacillus phage YungSlug]